MKKIISLLLAMLLIFSLCACSSSEGSGNSEEDKVISAVESRAIVEMTLGYETNGVPQITTASVEEVSENKWEVSGKITVNDKYGDSYTGTYDAVVEYNPETDDASVVDFDHTTPKKN